MRVSFLAFASVALAARPFLNEPDTGIDAALGGTPDGTLPDLSNMTGLPDFEWAARKVMNASAYTYYRQAAGGEWSYRNNLEVFGRYRFKPRVMNDISNVGASFPTTFLGYNFSMPFFISPAARAGLANEGGEKNLVQAAGEEGILYCPSLYTTVPLDEIAAAKGNSSQVTFQQMYPSNNDTDNYNYIKMIEKTGAKAIFLTVDANADSETMRGHRYDFATADTGYTAWTWETYHKFQNWTSLPLIPKGILSAEDAKIAVEQGVKAIVLSNHGGRQLDTVPSPFEVAIDIHNQYPEVFKQIEVYADGGVRYATDVLKFLALGVRGVGIARPFMYSNVYGKEGVQKAIQLMKRELAVDTANLGVADLKKIGPEFVNWDSDNAWYSRRR